MAKYRRIIVKFYEEIHDHIANDIVKCEIAQTRTEKSQINVLDMAMDNENINETFGASHMD